MKTNWSLRLGGLALCLAVGVFAEGALPKAMGIVGGLVSFIAGLPRKKETSDD